MIYLYILAGIICVAGLIVTFIAMNTTDSSYSNEKSLKTFSWLYILVVPIALIVVVVFAFLF